MSRSTPALLMTGVLTVLTCGLLWPRSSATPEKPSPPGQPSGIPPHTESAVVAGYKSWHRVNPTPHRVVSRLAALCAAPTPQQLAQASAGPHRDKFVTVYVNALGTPAMMHAKSPVFPQGTVIIKEKSATAGGPPELLTVMRKREQGYAPSDGDWQYLVLNGTATRVTAEGHLQTCRACHSQWRKTDYVSRASLPADVAGALR